MLLSPVSAGGWLKFYCNLLMYDVIIIAFSLFVNSFLEKYLGDFMINRILNLIDASNMSDSAICKELSIGNGIIGKWRKGLQKPSTEAIIKIAQYFNVSTDFLLLGDKNNTAMSIDDAEWLSLIHRLPHDAQLEFKGEIKGYLKCLNYESVTADEPLRKTGTDSLGK